MNPVSYIQEQVQSFPLAATWLIIALSACCMILLAFSMRQMLSPRHEERTKTTRYSEDQARSLLESLSAKLRAALFTHGEPSVHDGHLFFGDYEVNGRCELVDQVATGADQFATVFKGDTRAATNVRQADGSRAIGTRLAHGPAYVSAFENGKTFRGEAVLSGQRILAIYDPVKSGDVVVGMLFVGVRV